MSDLRWVEGSTTVKEFVKSIAAILTTDAENAKWELKHPASLGSVEDECILSAKPFTDLNEPDEKEFFLKIKRPDVDVEKEVEGEDDEVTTETVQEPSLNHVLLTIGDKLNEGGDDLDEDRSGVPARFAWYRDAGDVEGLLYGDWLPIRYWLNIDHKTINLTVQGEPSVDVAPYRNYLFSWAYIGALDSYEGGDRDVDGNFCLTVGSDVVPEPSGKFGLNTGNGVLDITMAYSRAGAPYQAHMPKFKTDNPYGDKYFIGASEWTHKYHFDEISVVHKYDRERGKLRNVLIGDRSAIYHNDELIYKKGDPEEEVYRAFQINAPYWMIEESANPFME